MGTSSFCMICSYIYFTSWNMEVYATSIYTLPTPNMIINTVNYVLTMCETPGVTIVMSWYKAENEGNKERNNT